LNNILLFDGNNQQNFTMDIKNNLRKTSYLSKAESPENFSTLQNLDRKIFNNSDFTIPKLHGMSKNELKDNINQALAQSFSLNERFN